MNLLNKLNKSILCEPARIQYPIYHILQNELLIVKKIIFQRHTYYITLLFSAILTLCLYSAK